MEGSDQRRGGTCCGMDSMEEKEVAADFLEAIEGICDVLDRKIPLLTVAAILEVPAVQMK